MRQYQIKFGELLLEAQSRVTKETNYTFREWCRNYVFKKDGAPYSYKNNRKLHVAGKGPRSGTTRSVEPGKERTSKKQNTVDICAVLPRP